MTSAANAVRSGSSMSLGVGGDGGKGSSTTTAGALAASGAEGLSSARSRVIAAAMKVANSLSSAPACGST